MSNTEVNFGNLTNVLHQVTQVYGRVKNNLNNPFQLMESTLDIPSENSEPEQKIKLEAPVIKKGSGGIAWSFLLSFVFLFVFSLVYLSGPIWNKIVFCGIAVLVTEATLYFA